jgi:hypothetical protein
MDRSMATDFQIFIEAFSRLKEEDRRLDEDFILCPPVEDFGYLSTPKNALTFSEMRVDGDHEAILKIDRVIRNDSPVVHISPMDSEDVFVVADSFLGFLAEGCRVDLEEMRQIIERECSAKNVLVPFLSNRFDGTLLLDEARCTALTAKYSRLIERKASPLFDAGSREEDQR